MTEGGEVGIGKAEGGKKAKSISQSVQEIEDKRLTTEEHG